MEKMALRGRDDFGVAATAMRTILSVVVNNAKYKLARLIALREASPIERKI
jgi:hypothetical protein